MKYIRQRYLLFELLTPSGAPISDKLLLKEIWRSLGRLFGERYTFLAGLWLIRYDPAHRIGILRYDNLSADQVIATLCFITKIGIIPVIIHTRKQSGTVKQTLKIWRQTFALEPPKREK